MKEIDRKIIEWHSQNKNIAIATLVKVYGSAPQPLGAKMAITEDLEFTGSVSGGCVEGDVIEQAQRVIKSSSPKLMGYGISDDSAWGLGLSCGGTIEVFVEPFTSLHEKIIELQHNHDLFAVITILNGNRIGEKQIVFPVDLTGDENKGLILHPGIRDMAFRVLQNQKSEKFDVRLENEECQVFCEIFSPPARLIIIGAIHIAMPLVELARLLNFSTVIVDPRSTFANCDRFPTVDQIVVGWPAEELEKLEIDENTFIAFISHDEKLDVPALQKALNSKARYIGVLGSRKTHAGRVEKLLELGVSAESLARLHAPIGLDIGASGAQEIALAIMAEMIAIRNGKFFPGKS